MTLKFTQNDRKLLVGTRVCEICGREGLLEYMYAMGASWHVTGHFMVPSFNCQMEPTAQHWGCTREHAMEALLSCLQHDEHMSVEVMRRKHIEAHDKGYSKVAPEHQAIADRYGGNFHFDYVSRLLGRIL